MMQQSLFTFSLLLLFLHCTKTLGQSPSTAPVQAPPAPVPPTQAPPAVPPAPVVSGAQTPAAQVQPSSGPLDVVKILQKGKRFTVFSRLLQGTGQDSELNKALNNSNGMTIFAPTDGAFSVLKAGFLNSLSDEDKTELVKFHVIPKFISPSQFQTESNPVKTNAGTGGRVVLNVTTTGNFVNITTGLTNTTISGTVYTDNQLAIYQVDQVLLPLDMFTPKAPAPAPAAPAEKPNKAAPVVESPTTTSTVPKDTSGALASIMLNNVVFLAIGIVVAIFSSGVVIRHDEWF